MFLESFEGLWKLCGAFWRQHWRGALRVRERLKISEEAVHLLLAGVVGIMGGIVNLVFHVAGAGIEHVVRPARSYYENLSSLSDALWPLLMPAVGALIAGSVLYWGLRLATRKGPGNLLEVVKAGDGRLPMGRGVACACSSLLSISSGSSIGREGMIVHLASTLASKWGQVARWQPYRLRLLVGCGAASGMAAAYNAPVGGAVFAAQIVFGNFSMHLFAPLVFSAVVASMVSRTFFGLKPWYQLPSFEFSNLQQLPWFLVLGVVSGVVGALFLKALNFSSRMFAKTQWPIYLRMAFGGLLVGAISLKWPEVWGNGYEATNTVLLEELTLLYLAGLLAAKVSATLITVGSGAVGGVFTPTMFIGATVGCIFGVLLHTLGIAITLPTGVFAVVGMGSVLSATLHSPLLAMIMVFELSTNYTFMPPLMLACVISVLVSKYIHADSVYTEPLRARGLAFETDHVEAGLISHKTVGDLMREPVTPLLVTTPFRQVADRFLTSPNNYLPVVDLQNHIVGVIALHDLKEHLNAGEELSLVIAYDIMRPPPVVLTPTQRLMDALPMLLTCDLRNLPVVNSPQEKRLVGSLSRAEALGLLSEALAHPPGNGR